MFTRPVFAVVRRRSAVLPSATIGASPATSCQSDGLKFVDHFNGRDAVAAQCIYSSCTKKRYVPPSHLIWTRHIHTEVRTPPASTEDSEEDSSTNSTSSNVRQSHWECMFESLKSYKAQHGDTFVPATYPEYPALGNWVDNQRQAYRMRVETENGGTKVSNNGLVMTDEKIEALNSIGFVWNLYEHAWNARYEELKQYIKEHGNSLVPGNYKVNESLGIWVSKQRRNYKVRGEKLKNTGTVNVDNETSLSPDRIEKLNEIGFVWDVHEAQWLERLEDLRRYRQDTGDTLVPKHCKGYPFLGTWVDKQRSDYKRFIAKKNIRLNGPIDESEVEKIESLSTGMTDERIQLLEAEDFVWEPQNFAWQLKYDEVCDWIALNGHGAIRQRGAGQYDPLARWADRQRSHYKKFLNGEKSTLTVERVEKLNRIGFVWEVEGKRTRSAAKKNK
eukprot:scaffold1538_cov190-Alexandrium_tamarense.AAC.7